MIEAIVGREEGKHRLLVKVGQEAFTLGNENSVPRNVSRTHCKIILDGNCIKVVNLKPESNIYVDGKEVESKKISEDSRLQLGESKYNVDLKNIISLIKKISGITVSESSASSEEYSLSPLKSIWEDYETTRLEMQIKEHRISNIRSGVGLLIPISGIATYIIPVLSNEEKFFIVAIIVIIMGGFILRSFKKSSLLVVKLHELDKEFRQRYVCPNPKCHIFVGNVPFDVLSSRKKCPNCGCKYKN